MGEHDDKEKLHIIIIMLQDERVNLSFRCSCYSIWRAKQIHHTHAHRCYCMTLSVKLIEKLRGTFFVLIPFFTRECSITHVNIQTKGYLFFLLSQLFFILQSFFFLLLSLLFHFCTKKERIRSLAQSDLTNTPNDQFHANTIQRKRI